MFALIGMFKLALGFYAYILLMDPKCLICWQKEGRDTNLYAYRIAQPRYSERSSSSSVSSQLNVYLESFHHSLRLIIIINERELCH